MINSWLKSKEALPIIAVAGKKASNPGKGEETQLVWMTNVWEHTESNARPGAQRPWDEPWREQAGLLHHSRQSPRSQQLLALPLTSRGLFSVILSRNLRWFWETSSLG